MKQNIVKAVVLGLLLFSFSTFANAQDQVSSEKKDRNIIVVGTGRTLEIAGKVTVIVVKETAKIVWKTTKFTAGEIAAPTAKALLLKVAPKVSLFLIKKAVPIAAKLVIVAAL
jgi:hypothetical protein